MPKTPSKQRKGSLRPCGHPECGHYSCLRTPSSRGDAGPSSTAPSGRYITSPKSSPPPFPPSSSSGQTGRVTRSMSGRQQLLLPSPPVVTSNNEDSTVLPAPLAGQAGRVTRSMSGRQQLLPLLLPVSAVNNEDATIIPASFPGGATNEKSSQVPVFPPTLEGVERRWVHQNALSNQPLNEKLKKVLSYIIIHVVKGAAKDRYVRWEITNPKFWSALQLQDPAASALASAPKERIKDVFVEITCGGPFDIFLSRLSNDRRRVSGLFVQLYGDENEVPCRSCTKRLVGSETGGHCGMWPMFGCRSIPGAFGNACGNCVAMVEGEKCTFRDEKYDHLRASSKRDPPLVSDLSASNSPTVMLFNLYAFKRLYSRYKEHIAQAGGNERGAQRAKGNSGGQGKVFWG
ncbi:uncharacterized protein BCR38DRAFT_506238 [Pseudomassariella vexata]|uniref:Uncharacterized protein n=1 Tax=Pseudomassariella vexata TaxID=1141098 RepID=A0A1Y2D7L1_9PEZI|nr:uncharacterized protein BCR38DRAFT_506238 [Pseudomassariella vexata]ORY55259.1 hypothetical protein BCR38DRAFT_506238 [Pseudomassariella vexata]